MRVQSMHRYQKQFQADPGAYHKPSKDDGGYWIAKVGLYQLMAET